MSAPSSTASSLHVESTGSGVPVVLLHSSGLSGRQWRRLAQGLSGAGFRATVPDLTGHGASPAWPEPTPFDFRTDVERLVAILEAEGPAHVVGHSYGALVGLLAALSTPRQVRSLVLFEPVAFGVLDPVTDAAALAELASVDVPWAEGASENDRWLRAFVDYWGGPGAWSALREEARAEFRRVRWVVREGVRTLMEDRTPASAYRALRCPVRVLTGERSTLAARTVAERLGQVIPGATVVTVPGAGHMGPLSHTELVNGAILDALALAPPTPRPAGGGP